MPYKKLEDAPANIRKLDGAALTLAQVNQIAKVADALKAKGDVELPWAVAISQFKKGHTKSGKGWKKKKAADKSVYVCPKCEAKAIVSQGEKDAIECPECGNGMRSANAPALGEDEKELLVEMAPRAGFKMLPNGKWLGWWTNAFEDREGELFETKAIEEYIEHFDTELKSLPLYFWHIPFELGRAEWLGMAGRIGIAAGTLNESGRKFAKFFEKRPDIRVAMSHGFMWLASKFRDKAYQWFRTKELTFVPAFAAANEATFWEGNVVTDKKKELLVEIVGAKEADAIIDSAKEATKAMEAEGLRFKEGEEDVSEDVTPEDTADATDEAGETPTATEEPEDEATSPDLLKDVRLKLAIPPELVEDISAKVVKALLGSDVVKGMVAAFSAQKAVLEAMSKADDEKVKELVKELPTIELYRGSKDGETSDKPVAPVKRKSIFEMSLQETIDACDEGE